MQIYEFLSKSQLAIITTSLHMDVCLYANIRIFKQITTKINQENNQFKMFVSMQIYEFLSKSQQIPCSGLKPFGCLSLCKYTNF